MVAGVNIAVALQGRSTDISSDSPDDADDTIQVVSHSLAQQRLVALANPACHRACNAHCTRLPDLGLLVWLTAIRD